jgi:hypothetical protein
MIARVIIAMHNLTNKLKTLHDTTYRSVDDLIPFAPGPSTMATSARRPPRTIQIPLHLRDIDYQAPSQRAAPQETVPEPVQNTTTLADESCNFIRVCIEVSIEKVEKYIRLLDNAPAYWGAMILHPGIKWLWIDRTFDSEHINRILTTFEHSFESEYPNLEALGAANEVEFDRLDPVQRSLDYLLTSEFYNNTAAPANHDELEIYFTEPPMHSVTDVVEWWRVNESKFPRLARMAFDILSIPAMSDDCERAFSKGGKLFGT